MGHGAVGRKALSTLGVLLSVLLLASSAQAAPTHLRKEPLDVTTGLNHACGAAVDSKGDLYLASAGESKVKVYNPSHVLLTEISDVNVPCGLAVTTTGALYVSERATGEVVRFKPNAYPFAGTPTYGAREVIDSSTKAKGIAVDPFDNRLYVAAGDHIAIYKSDGSFEANAGAGTLVEATGVAAFTYPNTKGNDRYVWAADAAGLGADRLYLFGAIEAGTLKLRRELNGATTPDGSFGFGAAGAYLAADPGNRNAEGKCLVVGEQACTAGHILLYDAGHKALDEFDASGEYLDRTANASFADAEPTAIAVERSGTANDGTIYVTTGAGAGAKALAFGPLKAPSRKALGEPLSHILETAEAVTTDSHGYVYVVAGTDIHIFDSSGVEKTTIKDEGKPRDVAVDSTGRVYVRDVNEGANAEFEVTYYTPSKYPPDGATTYTRRAEPVALPTEFPTGRKILRGIAINPGPGAGKDRLIVASNGTTHLHDSAANGSTLLDSGFGACVPGTTHVSVAVNGPNGTVYIGTNGHVIYLVDKTGTECWARIENTGAANGKIGPNPFIGVDQANGHVIAYDETKTAREYDAAGSFVAEFGTFTEGVPRSFRVAVDSACATHEPPLDETTTPTCKTYDPANGTVYVAFDDTNAAHPPYDVTAFGPLKYGLGNEKFPLTVIKTGTGSGKVTSTPSGIDCGSTCSAEFLETEVVTLKAEASPGSEFVKWSGPCSGSGECKVAVTEAKTVTAEFKSTAKPKFKLTVKKAGTGTGKVTSVPSGIDCGSTCSAEFEEGTEVQLSQSAEPGSEFTGWSGCGSEVAGKCIVTMGSAKEVTANFKLSVKKYALTITKTGAGKGSVTSSPAGIDCGPKCSAEFSEGAEVELTAEAESGSEFREWSGACAGASSTCTVTISEAKSVNARFSHARLLLALSKEGYGAVKSKPKGVSCGNTCAKAVGQFYKDTVVVLSAKAPLTGGFTSWEGCKVLTQTELESTCEVTMSKSKAIKATFKAPVKPIANPQVLTVSKAAGTGYGTVKGTGLACELACLSTEVPYFGGETAPPAKKEKASYLVMLTQIPAVGSSFSGWTGCDEVNGEGKCLVSMGSAKSVTARFDAKPKLTLTLSKEGAGAVKSKPKGVSCGNTCISAAASLPEGAVVVLTAKAVTGGAFTGWEGCKVLTQTELESTCEVTLSSAKAVKATFKAPVKPIVNPQVLTIVKVGTGTGTVKGTGLACEAACASTEVPYFGGETAPPAKKEKAPYMVILTAISSPGSDSVEWTGCDEVNGEGKCLVSMGKAKSVTARFEE